MNAAAPLVLQCETNECGLACLAMVLQHHGAPCTLPELRRQHPGGQPMSLDQLSGAAAALGFVTRALRCELTELKSISLPAILHVDFNHYVVLLKCTARRVTLLDPARGRVSLSIAQLDRRFTGIVMELQPGEAFQRTHTTHANSPRLDGLNGLDLLRRVPIKGLTASLVLLLALSISVQAFALASPFYLQLVIDEVLVAGDHGVLPVIAGGFLALCIISGVTQWFRGLIVIYTGNRLAYLLNAGLFQQLLALPLRFFERRTVGDIASRFASLRPVQEFLTDHAVQFLLDLLMIVTALFMLWCYSGRIAMFVVLYMAIFCLLQYLLLIPYRRISHEQIDAEAKVQTHFIESVQTIPTIRRFEAELRRHGEWLNRLTRSMNAGIRSSRIQLASETSRFMFSGSMVIAIAFLAVDQIIQGLLTIGMLYAMIAYTNHLVAALLSLTATWQRYLMLSLHAQRLADISESEPETRLSTLPDSPVAHVSLSEVNFCYPGSNTALFKSVSIDAGGNDNIAILGTSGSGKSTLLALLMGELPPATGEVQINGIPLGSHLDVRRMFRSVLQGDKLIAGTVMDNICYLDANPDHERMVQAARTACIHDEILRLPLGYLEQLNESCLLSAGQSQRILIARAVYRRAGILVLDEGTCHLDEATELEVMRKLLGEPGLCFFATHNENIAALADHQLTLDAP